MCSQQTSRETGRQASMQADRQAGGQTGKQVIRYREGRQASTQADKHTCRHEVRVAGKLAVVQSGRHACWWSQQTHTPTCHCASCMSPCTTFCYRSMFCIITLALFQYIWPSICMCVNWWADSQKIDFIDVHAYDLF